MVEPRKADPNPGKPLALVTGGAGFLGSHLVETLLSQGRRVRILDLAQPDPRHLADDRVAWCRGDILDDKTVAEAIEGTSEVYHLAANPRLWTRRRGDFHRVNFLGAVLVLDEAVRQKIPRILHCSTESILTLAKQRGPIRENQLVSIHDVVGPYCRSKFRAEKHAFGLARAGHPVFVVNPTLPFGPGDKTLSPPSRLIVDFCHGKRKEYLDATLNFMDARDMALAMVKVVEKGQPGKRYLLGAHNTGILSLFQELSGLTGIPAPRWKVPYPVALLAACISEIVADTLTGQEPQASITGVRLTRRTMHFDASESLKELGITPRPFQETLRDALAWWIRHGIISPQSLPSFPELPTISKNQPFNT